MKLASDRVVNNVAKLVVSAVAARPSWHLSERYFDALHTIWAIQETLKLTVRDVHDRRRDVATWDAVIALAAIPYERDVHYRIDSSRPVPRNGEVRMIGGDWKRVALRGDTIMSKVYDQARAVIEAEYGPTARRVEADAFRAAFTVAMRAFVNAPT